VNVKTKLSDSLRPLLLGALLLGSAVHAAVQPLDSVVAIVDNDVIMKSQLDQRTREVRQNIAKRGDGAPPPGALEPQVLDRLILENLQLQIGDRSGIRISDEELNAAIATIAQRNNMTVDQFRKAIAQDGGSYNDARDQVRREMIISRVRQRRVADRIQVSDQEVKNFLASDQGKVQLSQEFHLATIMVGTPESATSTVIQAAAVKAKGIYDKLKAGADFGQMAVANSSSENALDGGDIGWRKAAQLPPPFGDMLGSMPIGDVTPPARTPAGFIIIKLLEKRGGEGQAQMRDEVHVRHILIKPSEIRSEEETKRLAQKLYDRIEAGEDFGDLAKSFSEDPGSALNGGDMNWVDPTALVPEFREVMNDTPQGKLSKPFKTQYGWHVLEVLGRRSTDATHQARDQQAMNVLRTRKYDEELESWLRQIRDEAYVEIKLPGADKAPQ
jgi:peptidyl-prolyl cis-trans isomerase SurA